MRKVTRALLREDALADRLRRRMDQELANAPEAKMSALEALQMPVDDVIADTIEAIVSERSLHRVRDIEW